MSSIFSSLSLKRKDSSETVVSDNNTTVEKIKDRYRGVSIASKPSEWHVQRKFLVALLGHIKAYDKELDLNYCNETIKSNSTGTVNHLRSEIEISPGLYQIDDWNKAAENREKLINLQALFSKKLTDNYSRYQTLNLTITTACWKQMKGDLEIAESIPEIGNTWLAPVLVLLSKFPYFEASVKTIMINHSAAIKWEKKKTLISVTKHLKPLRGNILNDPIIPICDKLKIFKWATNFPLEGFNSESDFNDYKATKDLLLKGLNNEIFIDDVKWNSHIQNFLPEVWGTVAHPGSGLSFF